jgi:hypothetical protein
MEGAARERLEALTEAGYRIVKHIQ